MTKLDRCWKNCLRMWKWISENLKQGTSVEGMKRQWLKQNGFKKPCRHSCFFCEYDHEFWENDDSVRWCVHCPARMVTNQNFHCDSDAHSWSQNPKAFYAKLLELDAKRRAK